MQIDLHNLNAKTYFSSTFKHKSVEIHPIYRRHKLASAFETSNIFTSNSSHTTNTFSSLHSIALG